MPNYLGRLLYVGYSNMFFLSSDHSIISTLAIIVFDPLVDRSLILSETDWAQILPRKYAIEQHGLLFKGYYTII